MLMISSLRLKLENNTVLKMKIIDFYLSSQNVAVLIQLPYGYNFIGLAPFYLVHFLQILINVDHYVIYYKKCMFPQIKFFQSIDLKSIGNIFSLTATLCFKYNKFLYLIFIYVMTSFISVTIYVIYLTSLYQTYLLLK